MKISRAMLKGIKKMDIQELRQFLIGYYKNAYQDGAEKGIEISNRVDEESKVLKAANMTKGIGTKRAMELIENYRNI